MPRKTTTLIATFLLLAATAATASAQPPAEPVAQPVADPFADFTRDWRNDAAWHNDAVELAEYEALRVVDGQTRTHTVRITTHRELADPVTTTRSTTGHGRAAFKQHRREDVPADETSGRGTIHFSTMTYVGFDDLKSLKLAVGTIDGGGASFKQFVNHKGTLTWEQFSHLPSAGRGGGTYSPPVDLVFHDALPLVLRGYPFEKLERCHVHVLPTQASPALTNHDPAPAYFQYVGRETLDLPIGKIEAFRVHVFAAEEDDDAAPRVIMQYWFAADGKAPWLHVMVQHRVSDGHAGGGAEGTTYRLKSLRRLPYAAD